MPILLVMCIGTQLGLKPVWEGRYYTIKHSNKLTYDFLGMLKGTEIITIHNGKYLV